MPVHAACPLDSSGENICSVSDFEKRTPLGVTQAENMINFSSEQKPIQTENAPAPLNISPVINNLQNQYDSACQFGVCLQDLNNTINKNQ